MEAGPPSSRLLVISGTMASMAFVTFSMYLARASIHAHPSLSARFMVLFVWYLSLLRLSIVNRYRRSRSGLGRLGKTLLSHILVEASC